MARAGAIAQRNRGDMRKPARLAKKTGPHRSRGLLPPDFWNLRQGTATAAPSEPIGGAVAVVEALGGWQAESGYWDEPAASAQALTAAIRLDLLTS
jgi:hypothetical protein